MRKQETKLASTLTLTFGKLLTIFGILLLNLNYVATQHTLTAYEQSMLTFFVETLGIGSGFIIAIIGVVVWIITDWMNK